MKFEGGKLVMVRLERRRALFFDKIVSCLVLLDEHAQVHQNIGRPTNIKQSQNLWVDIALMFKT